MVRTLLASLALTLTLACGGSSDTATSSAAPPPAPISDPAPLRSIAPATTDPAISTYLNDHLAAPPGPTATPAHRLFVMLPGTGAQPASEQLILQTGSSRGYHVIGLMYPNGSTIESLCANSTDPNAHWDARREVITGQDLSTLVDVSPTECIIHRLTALLTYLAATYPSEGWDQYLVSGQPDWTKIVISGHSQGGGHAAVIAKLYPVYRCVCFSNPGDWSIPLNQPASWLSFSGVTDTSRIYGFVNLQDELFTWDRAQVCWAALGLGAYGPPVSVDGSQPPYSGSHQLTTDLTPASTAGNYPYHGSTAQDAATPELSDGTPVFRPVWIWLCFP